MLLQNRNAQRPGEKSYKRSIVWQSVLYTVFMSTVTVGVLVMSTQYLVRTLLHERSTQLVSLMENVPNYVLAAAVKQAEVDAQILVNMLTVIGLICLVLSALLSVAFSRHLLRPLQTLVEAIAGITPGKWNYKRSVFTGDEVETLDATLEELCQRLRGSYHHLESEVHERTKELKAASIRDNAILQSISLGLMVVNTEGQVQEANAAAAKTLRTSEQKLAAMNIRDALGLRDHQRLLPETENPVFRCLITKQAALSDPNLHYALTCADGTLVSVRLSVFPINEGKNNIGAVVLFQDVTAERQIEYLKTEFITLASHQLRTPLSTVQWYVELLSTEEQERLSDQQKSFLVELRMAAHRMVNIVSDLLDASRLREDGVKPHMQRLDITRFIKDMTEEMRAVGASKNISVTAALPPVVITTWCDPMLLSIILQNLISNAVKYSSPQGAVKVGLSMNEQRMIVTVQDSGIGIPEADKPRIFEKLFRAKNALTKDVNGSGLGLYSAKAIANKLGGDITFVSKEGEGTTFTLSLPLQAN